MKCRVLSEGNGTVPVSEMKAGQFGVIVSFPSDLRREGAIVKAVGPHFLVDLGCDKGHYWGNRYVEADCRVRILTLPITLEFTED